MKKKSPSKKSSNSRASRPASADDSRIRLQKVLADHGRGSRRECEEYILAGRVEVDGQVVKKLGTKVDPESQKVTFDGERLIARRLQYFILNKPPGVVSTAKDPSGRLRVIDLIKTNQRVYNVGRLDKSSEGLILVTNDGDLANKLTHPRYGVDKKYHVLVKGRPSREALSSLKKGMYLAEAKVQVQNVRVKKSFKDRTWLEIILDEGRNREIRRILAKIGHKVYQLRRVAIGPLVLGDLPLGTHRQLSPAEVKRLKKATSTVVKNPRRSKKTSASRSSSGRSATSRGARVGSRTTKKKSTRSKSARGSKKSGVSRRGAARGAANTGRSVKKKSLRPRR